MPSVKKDYIRASASVPSGHYRLLEKLAEKNKVSVAWIIRDAVEKYLVASQSKNDNAAVSFGGEESNDVADR